MRRRPIEERLAEAVQAVLACAQYGYREEPCSKTRHIMLVWSNAQARWFAASRWWTSGKCRNGVIRLDANEILVDAASQKEADAMAAHLPNHPLYGGSTEAKERGIYDPITHLEAQPMFPAAVGALRILMQKAARGDLTPEEKARVLRAVRALQRRLPENLNGLPCRCR